MNKKDIFQLISKNLKVPEEDINIETSSKNFGAWDSLAHLRIILELEKRSNIKVRNDQIGELNSVKKIIKYFVV